MITLMNNHDNKSDTGGGPPLDTCPVSGLKITRKPEWTDIPLTEGYGVTFELIGDRILHTMPLGFCGDRGVEVLFREKEQMVRRMTGDGRKFVELRDYTGIRGRPNRLARRQMVRGLRA